MAAQGGSSWSDRSRAYKYYLATQGKNTTSDFYWRPTKRGAKDGLSYSKQCFDNLTSAPGELDKFKKTMDAYHAFTYEILMNTDMPNIDKVNKRVRLVRMEVDEAIKKHKPGETDVIETRGAAESLSLLNSSPVAGRHFTEQWIPFSNVMGTYFTDRGPNDSSSAFLGEDENEFLCLLGQTPFDYIYVQ